MNTNPNFPQPRSGPPSHHRRSHSDTSFFFTSQSPSPQQQQQSPDEDFSLFDIDNLTLDSLDLPGPTTTQAAPHSPSPSPSPTLRSVPNHLRSVSVDADFFEGLQFDVGSSGGGAGERKGGSTSGGHRRTNSVDSVGGYFDCDGEGNLVDGGVKKAMPPEKLAELALIDPKRAKRILANRQSAARSKERKIRYTSELEKRVQTLQTEATTLSAQVTMLQRDTSGLTNENKELKLRLHALEQQAQLRDALNEALRQEVQRLRVATGQIPSGNNTSASSRPPVPQFPANHQNLPPFGRQQNQQQQLQQQPPQQQQQQQLQQQQQQQLQQQQMQQQQQQQQQLQQQQQQQQFQMHNQQLSAASQAVQKQMKPNFLDFNRMI